MSSNIYILIDPITNEIRYVGLTTRHLKLRLSRHINDKSNTHKCNWIKQLRRYGQHPIIKSIQTFDNITYDDLRNAEVYWIKHFKEIGCDLTNSTDGGDGKLGSMMSEESRIKLSKLHKGKKHSEEHRLKISKSLKGKKQGSHSEETKKKIRLSMIKRKSAQLHTPMKTFDVF